MFSFWTTVSVSSLRLSHQLHRRPPKPEVTLKVTPVGHLHGQHDLSICLCCSAVGCADVAPPANGWSRRIESRMELGCTSTGRQWTLTCVGNRWTGDLTATCDSSRQSSSSSFNIDGIADQFAKWYRQIADYTSSVPLGQSVCWLVIRSVRTSRRIDGISDYSQLDHASNGQTTITYCCPAFAWLVYAAPQPLVKVIGYRTALLVLKNIQSKANSGLMFCLEFCFDDLDENQIFSYQISLYSAHHLRV